MAEAGVMHPILLVEDDMDIRQTLADLLALEGYRVEAAANGAEALARLAEMDAPCLILLDLMMPVMKGWEFLAAFESRPERATVPVAIVSAATELQSAARHATAGVLRKPFEHEELMRVVRSHCGCGDAAAP